MEHAQTFHGFPVCLKCGCFYKNVNLFEKHLNVAHEKVQCGFHNCLVTFYASDEIQHLTSVHGYPHCGVCHTTSKGVKWYMKHIMVCQDPLVQCGLCDDVPMPKSELRNHVVLKHGFPSCPKCLVVIGDNQSNFITHVAMCKIDTDKLHTCLACNMVFETRYMYNSHVSGECVPTGSVALSYDAYAKLVHGMPITMVYGNTRMRAVWDMSAYCPSLIPVRQLTGGIPLKMESEKEVMDREAPTDDGFGGLRSGPYEFDEDPRIFQKGIFSVVHPVGSTGGKGMSSMAWLFRLMGTPWEIGGAKSRALLPDHRLCLMDYFRQRPACDVWIYLISRFDKYRRTVDEINEVKGLMTSCELPLGVAVQYRDMEFVRVFCENIRLLTEKSRLKVTYETTGGNDRRCVVEEVTQLSGKRKRGVFLKTNLPVPIPVMPFDAVPSGPSGPLEPLEPLEPLVDIETLGVSGVSGPPVTLVFGAKEALAVWGLSEKYDVLEQQIETGAVTGPATVINARKAALTTAAPQDYARQVFDVVKTRDWFGVCWEVIYMVYRDFVTYFVTTGTFGRLHLFSNFGNEKPSHVQLEELLFRFRPFIVRDLQVPLRAARATALFYGLNDEARLLRCLFLNNLKIDRLQFRALHAYDTDLCRFQAQSVHRSPHRDVKIMKKSDGNYGKPYYVPVRVSA